MASSTLPAIAHSGNGYVTSKQACQLLGGCSPTWLRHLCDAGELSTLSGESHKWRRVSVKSIREYLGDYSEDEASPCGTEGKTICIYARVSDISQNVKGGDGKSSLQRQVERLLDEVSKREGIDPAQITVYKDVASSFGNREGLNRLMDSVIDGRVSKVYCLYLDRLSRVPALTRLVEHLCERFGVPIVCLDVESSEDDFIKYNELLGYITVWANRQSADKSRVVTTKHLTPETLQRMLTLRASGLTVKAVWRKLVEEGHTTSHGDIVSYMLVRKHLDNNGNQSALSAVTGIGSDNETTETFLADRLTKTESETDRLTMEDVYPRYVSYCQSQGKVPTPRNILGRIMVKKMGKYDTKIGGRRFWKGWQLVG